MQKLFKIQAKLINDIYNNAAYNNIDINSAVILSLNKNKFSDTKKILY